MKRFEFVACFSLLILSSCSPNPDDTFNGYSWSHKMTVSFEYKDVAHNTESLIDVCAYNAGRLQGMINQPWNGQWSGSGAHADVPGLGNVVFLWDAKQRYFAYENSVESPSYKKLDIGKFFEKLSTAEEKKYVVPETDVRVVIFNDDGKASYFENLAAFSGHVTKLKATITVAPLNSKSHKEFIVIAQPWYQAWKLERREYLAPYDRWWESFDEFPSVLGLPINKLGDSDFTRPEIGSIGSPKQRKLMKAVCEGKKIRLDEVTPFLNQATKQ